MCFPKHLKPEPDFDPSYYYWSVLVLCLMPFLYIYVGFACFNSITIKLPNKPEETGEKFLCNKILCHHTWQVGVILIQEILYFLMNIAFGILLCFVKNYNLLSFVFEIRTETKNFEALFPMTVTCYLPTKSLNKQGKQDMESIRCNLTHNVNYETQNNLQNIVIQS